MPDLDHLARLKEGVSFELSEGTSAYLAALEAEIGIGLPPIRRSQLRDVAFFEANQERVLRAAREGTIVDDIGKEATR